MLAQVVHSGAGRGGVLCAPRRMGAAPSAGSLAISGGISAGVALAEDGLNQVIASKRLRGGQKIATTEIVNSLGEQLTNLLNAYNREPASCANQRAALNAFDSAWAWLQSPDACGNIAYGSAGERCISDRAPGGRWPYQSYYRDPIANDPRLNGQNCDTGAAVLLPGVRLPALALPAAVPAASAAGTSAVTSGLSSYLPYALAGLAALVIFK